MDPHVRYLEERIRGLERRVNERTLGLDEQLYELRGQVTEVDLAWRRARTDAWFRAAQVLEVVTVITVAGALILAFLVL